MSWSTTQKRLAEKGFDPGAIDGKPGPRTYGALFAYMAGRDFTDAPALGAAAADLFGAAGLSTPLRIAHFLAQASHETGRFRFRREIWGPTEAQRRYEGRRDLGNTVPGDGKKFMGRGIFQLTGRANYQRYGQLLGIDLACSPELAEVPYNAVAIACLYWKERGLNALADADDARGITRRINGGFNGFEDRKGLLDRAKAVLL